MKSLVLSQFPMIYLTVGALLIFFGFFCGMVTLVFSRHKVSEFQNASQLPLEEGSHHDE